MDGYRLVLFLHLSALLGAIATSAVLHFAETRLRAADTTAAVRTWAGLIDKGARVFPLVLLVLLGTGAYLVDRSWTWSSGWVVAGLVGVGVPFIVGAGVVGGRSRALRRALTGARDGAVPAAVARIAREHPGGIASWTNTGLCVVGKQVVSVRALTLLATKIKAVHHRCITGTAAGGILRNRRRDGTAWLSQTWARGDGWVEEFGLQAC